MGFLPGGADQPGQSLGLRPDIVQSAAQQETVIDRTQTFLARGVIGGGKQQPHRRAVHHAPVVELAFVHEGQEGVQNRAGGVEHLVQKHHLGLLHHAGVGADHGVIDKQLAQIVITEQFGRLGELGQQILEIPLVFLFRAAAAGRQRQRVVIQNPHDIAETAHQPRLRGAGRADHHHRLAGQGRQQHAFNRTRHAVETPVEGGFQGHQRIKRAAMVVVEDRQCLGIEHRRVSKGRECHGSPCKSCWQ